MNYRTVYKYNKADKTGEQVSYYHAQKTVGKKELKYDAKGNKIEEIRYDIHGKPDHKYGHKYDERGNLVETISYKGDGSLYSTTTFKFNEKNQRIEYTIVTPGYANSSRKFTYDEKGNISEEIWLNGKNEIDFRFVRTYDDKGNKVQEVKYKGADKLLDTVKWNYVFDKNGNWFRKIDIANDGVEFHKEERTIVYY